jgi:hypothetical protein
MDGKMRKKSEALGTNLKKLEHVLYELTLIKAGKTTPVAKVCLLDQFARTQGTSPRSSFLTKTLCVIPGFGACSRCRRCGRMNNAAQTSILPASACPGVLAIWHLVACLV